MSSVSAPPNAVPTLNDGDLSTVFWRKNREDAKLTADLQSLYSLRRLGLKCPLGTCPKEVLALTILLTTHYPLPTTTYYVLRTTHYYLPLTTHH